jgi:putative FmdB family regulatory protein
LTLVCARPYNRCVPLYEYECQACHFRFEKLQRLSDPPPPKCPECGGKKIVQMMSASSAHFKGSGWYVTDYGRKGSGGDRTGEKKAESKPEAKSETKGETKTESKSETRTKTETKSDSKGAKDKK